MELDDQCIHLAYEKVVPLRVLLARLFLAFWEDDVVWWDSVALFATFGGLIQPDRVLIGPQEDGVLGVRTGGAAQSASHDRPVGKSVSQYLWILEVKKMAKFTFSSVLRPHESVARHF